MTPFDIILFILIATLVYNIIMKIKTEKFSEIKIEYDTVRNKMCSDESINNSIYNYSVNELNLQNINP